MLQGKVHLVDFNPFGSVTDSLLFSWDELENSNSPLKGSHDDEITDVSRNPLYAGIVWYYFAFFISDGSSCMAWGIL